MIQRVTGERPTTCPWRALYDPFVGEVMRLSRHYESGNLAAFMEDDPPAILLEGLSVYRRALDAVRAEEEKLRQMKAEQERRPRR